MPLARALRIPSRDECMISSRMSSMSASEWFSERKWSETVVSLEEGVGLSTGRRCSSNLSLSLRFVSPMYCLSQLRQCTM